MSGIFDLGFALVAIFIVGVAIAIIVAIVRGGVVSSRQAAANRAAPEVSALARVADKRIQVTGGGESMVRQSYFVTFEQPSGERFELQVAENQYGLLVVGDQGTVTMKGTAFLGFTRELMR